MNFKAEFKPIALVIIAILTVSFLLIVALKTLLPLVIAVFIAALIDPVINYLETKTELDRGLIVAITLSGIFLGLGYTFTLLLVRLAFELKKLINTLPIYKYYYSAFMEKASLQLMDIFEQIPKDVWSFFNENLDHLMTTVTSTLMSYYRLAMNKISTLPGLLTGMLIFLIFTFLFSYFISKDKDRIIDGIKHLFPDALQEKVRSFQVEILVSFMRLIKAQIVLVIISTLVTITGFYMLKVEYALILGIFCGFLDLLPVVGPSLIFIPWIGATVIIGNLGYAIKLLILFIVILGNRQMLQAKIVGQNLGIDPLLSLISIYLGVVIFGFLGLIVGPLVVVMVRSLIHSGLIPPLKRPQDKY